MRKVLAVIFTIGAMFTTTVNIAQAGERTCTIVVDQKAYDETIIDQEAVPGQHYSYVGGPIEGTPAPPPADGWQANTQQEPPGHYQTAQKPDGSAYVEGDSGLHYVSHGSSGLADWFYFQAGTDEVSHVVHHDAKTHRECTKTTPPAKAHHLGARGERFDEAQTLNRCTKGP